MYFLTFIHYSIIISLNYEFFAAESSAAGVLFMLACNTLAWGAEQLDNNHQVYTDNDVVMLNLQLNLRIRWLRQFTCCMVQYKWLFLKK